MMVHLGFVECDVTTWKGTKPPLRTQVRGPYLEVRDTVAMFSDVAIAMGHAVATEWRAIEGPIEMEVDEWEEVGAAF